MLVFYSKLNDPSQFALGKEVEMAKGANPRDGQSMKPLMKAKPGGVEATNPKTIPPKGNNQAQDEVPRGGNSIKGYEGQISR